MGWETIEFRPSRAPMNRLAGPGNKGYNEGSRDFGGQAAIALHHGSVLFETPKQATI